MDTNRLKRFATEARNILMQGVAHRFTSLGFSLDGTTMEEPQRFEGGATFMGETVSLDFYDKWQSLSQAIQQHGIKVVIEEAAYTWFNRLMAIRIMVKNQLIPPVLQYESEGVFVPLLVTEARQGRFPQMPEDDRRKLMALLDDDSKTEDQFRILIVAFCHSTPIINACFGHIKDYTELLLPTNILAEGGFVDLINHTEFIAEEDYKSPELIGWLYQFYISEKKDEVFAKKGKFDSDEIPAATQIFTPNWIVKYLVQNTIGRIYLDNNPYEAEIKHKWKYLVEPTEKTPDDKILHYDDLTELKFGDLACGSGHILNEGFDILYDLYILEGYNRKDAIENIFCFNLTGIDIDTRAKQLAQFALLLKACQKDISFADAHLMPRVLDMPQVDRYTWRDLGGHMECALQTGASESIHKELDDCFILMEQANNLGSIMKFNVCEETRDYIKQCIELQSEKNQFADTFSDLFHGFKIILAITDKYSALVMNPPYMGSGNMNNVLSDYVKNNYEEGKADLFSTFMILAIDHLAEQGKYGMITMHSWMFLSSFERLRKSILDNYHIDSLLHLGPRTFDEIGGEVVQNSAFVVSKSKINENGIYCRLIKGRNSGEKEHLFLNPNENNGISYRYVNQNNFKVIPGWLIGYWLSNSYLNSFKIGKQLRVLANVPKGLSTGSVDRFIRFWYECSFTKIDFKCSSCEESAVHGYKWFPYAKGGAFRRWNGNLEYVVNWENDGKEVKNFVDENGKQRSRPQNTSYYFKECLTYSAITSSKYSLRYLNKSIFGGGGDAIHPIKEENLMYILAFMNTKIAQEYLRIISPTLNFEVDHIKSMPFIQSIKDNTLILSKSNIDISKQDWDSHETSWDFETNPLISLSGKTDVEEEGEIVGLGPAPDSIVMLYQEYKAIWEQYFNKLHENEEELNRQFIEIYGLQDELTPDVPLDEITILQQGEISIQDNEIVWHPDVVMKQLISYAIGCMMGRYSIDKPGLILANQGDGIEQYKKQVPDSRFKVDEDGIIPLMSAQSDFADNATLRFKQWLSVAFGEETLVENLNFIEKCLGKSVDDYFVKDFWKDHKKMYQNRPIYWLFSSSKGAFQCLAYMHRMDAYTAERVRTKYLLPHIEWLIQQQGELEANAANLSGIERKRLDSITKQIQECREYHDRLHVIADQQIAFDLDDGVVVNYAKFGDVLAKIK